MSDESIRVDLESLDQFAAGVAGGLAGTGGSGGMALEFLEPSLEVGQEMLTAQSYGDPFGGGGLQEGQAFAGVHQAYVQALNQFLADVGEGLTTLGMAAANIRWEYAYGDADSAAVTESVYGMFAPSLEAAEQVDRRMREDAWHTFVAEHADHGLFGNAMIYLAGGTQADVQLGRDLQRLAAAAQDDSRGSAHEGEFDQAVEAHVEDGGGVTVEGGGMGDLGRGTTGTPIMGEDGTIVDWIPADDERVADTPPQALTERPAGAGG